MEGKSVFISSCTRRELARRRSSRSLMRIEWRISLVLLAVAVAAFVVMRGL